MVYLRGVSRGICFIAAAYLAHYGFEGWPASICCVLIGFGGTFGWTDYE